MKHITIEIVDSKDDSVQCIHALRQVMDYFMGSGNSRGLSLAVNAGFGGNRKFWDGANITAVEMDIEIANIYSTFYPGDTV